jgi:hypothetical protein
MSRPPKFPLVPKVDYPSNHNAREDDLHEAYRAAIRAHDPGAQADAQLELAHSAMVTRDSRLSELVAAIHRRDGEDVLLRASSYAFWHGTMERDVERAAEFVKQARGQVADPEAER